MNILMIYKRKRNNIQKETNNFSEKFQNSIRKRLLNSKNKLNIILKEELIQFGNNTINPIKIRYNNSSYLVCNKELRR